GGIERDRPAVGSSDFEQQAARATSMHVFKRALRQHAADALALHWRTNRERQNLCLTGDRLNEDIPGGHFAHFSQPSEPVSMAQKTRKAVGAPGHLRALGVETREKAGVFGGEVDKLGGHGEGSEFGSFASGGRK